MSNDEINEAKWIKLVSEILKKEEKKSGVNNENRDSR